MSFEDLQEIYPSLKRDKFEKCIKDFKKKYDLTDFLMNKILEIILSEETPTVKLNEYDDVLTNFYTTLSPKISDNQRELYESLLEKIKNYDHYPYEGGSIVTYNMDNFNFEYFYRNKYNTYFKINRRTIYSISNGRILLRPNALLFFKKFYNIDLQQKLNELFAVINFQKGKRFIF